MDYFAHGFWSYILFHWIKNPWRAVAFGLLPDTASWFIYFLYRLILSEGFGEFSLNGIPGWVFSLYNVSHSLILAVIAITLVSLYLKKFPVYMLAWPIAIIIDIFTHTREFLPTPFLWPLSTWTFPGISWGNGWFVLVNYTLITLALAYIIIKKRHKKRK